MSGPVRAALAPGCGHGSASPSTHRAGSRRCRGAVLQAQRRLRPPPTPLTCLVAGFILADLMIKPGSRVYNLNVLKIALSLFSF